MPENNPLILMKSASPQELLKAALPYARSPEPGEQRTLAEAMASEDFLNRLDSQQDYLRYPPQQLRLARVFKILFTSMTEAAKETLVSLTAAHAFNTFDPREELLVKALAVVRPAPPEAIRYWQAHSLPDSVHLTFTIKALCDNGSDPAIGLLERKLADPEQEFDFKLLWMRDPILRHRNDVPLLKGCEHMVTGGLPQELRPLLVEALCDYRRDEWYRSCSPPVPPARALASHEAKDCLRRICRYAKDNLSLDPTQTAAVEQTLVEIGGNGR